MHDSLKRNVPSEIKVIIKLSFERKTSHGIAATKKYAEKNRSLKNLNGRKV
jgi:hypothetical protein